MLNRQIFANFVLIVVISLFSCTLIYGETLTWEPSTGTVSGYYLFYGKQKDNPPQGGTFEDVVETTSIGKITVSGNVNETSLDSVSLSANEYYCFAVKAFNDTGESDYSEYLVWVPNDTTPPAPPSGVSWE
jgi:hypothetical protein